MLGKMIIRGWNRLHTPVFGSARPEPPIFLPQNHLTFLPGMELFCRSIILSPLLDRIGEEWLILPARILRLALVAAPIASAQRTTSAPSATTTISVATTSFASVPLRRPQKAALPIRHAFCCSSHSGIDCWAA